MTRYLIVLLAMAAVIAAPMLLRPEESYRTRDYAAKDRLAIITPHVETIRYELERGFARWMREKHGRSVVIDWRVPGGTSEIVKVINSEFKAAASMQSGNGGIGMDLMLGGGPVDFNGLKRSGSFVASAGDGRFGPAAVKAAHPDWFTETGIPASVAGQAYYDPELYWIGTCLSAFGICCNKETLKRRGIKPPETWSDLTNPAFENQLALADPTKSGTVAAMFECILQIQIGRDIDEALGIEMDRTEYFRQSDDPERDRAIEAKAILSGWWQGLNTIRCIGANARYWTDSSTKIPLDVAEGEALAGMCVDFYGRNIVERLTKVNGGSRLGFIAPLGGTTISPQPVAMFQGAPNPELATRFIEFILSPEGQKLWGFKAGTPGGPERMALRNMPVRRDYYVPENLKYAADPDLRPMEQGVAFVYEPKYTAELFSAIRFVIRAMCIDPHQELKEAWHELIVHKFPPQAMEAFSALPGVDYSTVKDSIAPKLRAKDPIAIAQLARDLSEQFRANYMKARELARARK